MVAAHLENVAFVACNTFRLADEHTTFADAFRTADRIVHLGVRGVNDFVLVPGLVNRSPTSGPSWPRWERRGRAPRRRRRRGHDQQSVAG